MSYRAQLEKNHSFKFILTVIVIIVVIIACGKIVSSFIDNLPSIQQLGSYTPNLSTKIYDRDNNLMTELFIEKRALVSIRDIPVDLQNSFISIEDNDFFKHWGISMKGIARALSKILSKRRVAEGGSTITQQLAKTIFLTREKTITRKIKEVLLAIQLEKNYSKNEILQFYINQIYFGSGAHGVQSAAEIYFNKNVKDLTLAQCAMLAALPKSPNYYNPFKNPKSALTRRNLVLSRMRQLGYITQEQEKEALETPLPVKPDAPKEEKGHYFVEALRLLLEPKYGTNVLFRDGLSIYTTLDMQAQIVAEKVIEESLANFDNTKASFFEKTKQMPVKVQGALIAMDPRNGAIRAMVGGRSFKESQFNRATQAKRQAGSAFKPFVYLTAIEQGFTPASLVEDKPLIFVRNKDSWDLTSRNTAYLKTLAKSGLTGRTKIWSPKNYGGRFMNKKVTLSTALALSINTCAVELITKTTPIKVIEMARRLGITTPLANSCTIALGSSDVILEQMVSAFAVFACGGIKTQPYVVTRILDKDGKVLEEHLPQQEEVLSEQTCFVLTNMLRAVVERGTGGKAKNLGRPCAGKTGTSTDNNDAWFVGYTPQLVAGVWVGYDDRSMYLGNSTGGGLACPIWTKFMKEALEGQPILDFKQPEWIEWALVDPSTGLLAPSKTSGAFLEAFKQGSAPTQYCNQQSKKSNKQNKT